MKLNVHELRQQGYRVRVSHYRELHFGVDVFDTDDFDYYLTRVEYELLNTDNIPWGENVKPHGGFTTVEVTTPDNQVLHGKFNFPKSRPFNRKIGLTAALGRAFTSLSKKD